jgi:hypothetical protein
MITLEKLDLYERLDGDIDTLVRLPSHAPERTLISESEWHVIKDLLNRLWLSGSGLTAESFDAETHRLVAEHIPDGATLERMWSLARQRGR